MTTLKEWSTTAANNNAASPDGFPEAMLPSALNNSFREVMAGIKSDALIWWDSVASMRAITADPEAATRHALIPTSSAVVRYYAWTATAAGADDGITLIRPTGTLSAGAFKEIGWDTSFTTVIHHTFQSFTNTKDFRNVVIGPSTATAACTGAMPGTRGGARYMAFMGSGKYMLVDAVTNVKPDNFGAVRVLRPEGVMLFNNLSYVGGSASATSFPYELRIIQDTQDNLGDTSVQTMTVNTLSLQHLNFPLSYRQVYAHVGGTTTATLHTIGINFGGNPSVNRGARILIRPSSGQTLIVQNGFSPGVGQLKLRSATFTTLNSVHDTLLFHWDVDLGYWVQQAGSDNS